MACDLRKEHAKRFHHFSGLRRPGFGYLSSSETPRHPCVGAGALCPGEGWSPAEPEHEGEAPRRCCNHLRRAVLRASPVVERHCRATIRGVGTHGARRALVGRSRGDASRRVNLRSHLVAYQAPTRRPRRRRRDDDHDDRARTDHDDDHGAARAGTDHDDDHGTAARRHHRRPRRRRRHRLRRNSRVGEATWYSEAAGRDVRQPDASLRDGDHRRQRLTGASTTCTVDDREGAGYPRVVDMSPEGFSQIADLGQGVVDVTISW